MKNICGCCDGLDKLTPVSTANRPGLDALIYRVGTHASFMESMLACLSNNAYPELAALTNRAKDDPSIALLDAWATVADVLTFYQERIANEAYLRTALERRSILELARLVGYNLRPGVSASVFLGFTMDKDVVADIPAGTRAQSIPGPGELPQAFETSEAIPAREEWNALKPRLTKPQVIDNNVNSPYYVNNISEVYIEGTSTNLKPNDALLFVFGVWSGAQKVRYVAEVEPQSDPTSCWERTRVRLQPVSVIFMGAQGVRVLKVAEKFLDTETFDVSVTSAMAKRVVSLATRIKKSISVDSSDENVMKLFKEILPDLREEHAIAIEGHYGRLEPWVGGFVKELEGIETELKNIPRVPDAKRSFATRSTNYENDCGPADTVLGSLVEQGLIEPLKKPASIQPTNAQRLPRDITLTYARTSDTAPRLLSTLKPSLKPILYDAIEQTEVVHDEVKVYALRTSASLFGHNFPKEPHYDPANKGDPTWVEEWEINETNTVLYLNNSYEKVQPGEDSYIVVNKPDVVPLIFNNFNVNFPSRAEYGVSAKSTKITLPNGYTWFGEVNGEPDINFDVIRGTNVYAENELLTLAEMPILAEQVNQEATLAPLEGKQIELAELYDGLEAGRWVIISGERFDAPGVIASELLMVASVEQSFDPTLTGDKPHTVLMFAETMSYQYKRDDVTIYGNVVKATHGETRTETLGSGDASKAFQQFTLSFTPLAYVAANTTSGVESTLEVRVNDVLWQEAVSIFGLDANDRQYITRTDNDAKTTLHFGEGIRGLRLPTGTENVSAIYRSGIGKSGNVDAEQISLLATRPLGVKGVINPLSATGGADRETRDQARRNTPFAVMALDRLVSVQDYADFARTFAGIGKASATRLTDGNRQLVYVTIAGAEDIPIDKTSDLYHSLLAALHKFGDPYQPIQLAIRELILLIIHARVRVSPEYQWETVEPKIRTALLDHFSFERRELGQDALLSEAISVIQGITGVAYVDVDVFDGLVEIEPIEDLIADIEDLGSRLGDVNQPNPRVPAEMAEFRKPKVDDPYPHWYMAPKHTRSRMRGARIGTDPHARKVGIQESSSSKPVLKPAQIAVFKPEIKDTLILTEMT